MAIHVPSLRQNVETLAQGTLPEGPRFEARHGLMNLDLKGSHDPGLACPTSERRKTCPATSYSGITTFL